LGGEADEANVARARCDRDRAGSSDADAIIARGGCTAALALDEQTKAWAMTPPSAEQCEQMMKKVLALHVAAAKLFRPKAR
jgi:hypothetical protein